MGLTKLISITLVLHQFGPPSVSSSINLILHQFGLILHQIATGLGEYKNVVRQEEAKQGAEEEEEAAAARTGEDQCHRSAYNRRLRLRSLLIQYSHCICNGVLV